MLQTGVRWLCWEEIAPPLYQTGRQQHAKLKTLNLKSRRASWKCLCRVKEIMDVWKTNAARLWCPHDVPSPSRRRCPDNSWGFLNALPLSDSRCFCFSFPVRYPVSSLIYLSFLSFCSSQFLSALKIGTAIMRQQWACWGVCEGVSFAGPAAEGALMKWCNDNNFYSHCRISDY